MAVPQRRVLAVPFVDCSGPNQGQTSLPVVGLGCFFLLQPVHARRTRRRRNDNNVFGEYIGECGADGTPGPEPDPDPAGRPRHLQDRAAQRPVEPGLVRRRRSSIAARARARAGSADSRPSSSSSTAPFMLFLMLAQRGARPRLHPVRDAVLSVRHATRFVSENSINGTTGVVATQRTDDRAAPATSPCTETSGGTGNPRLPNFQGARCRSSTPAATISASRQPIPTSRCSARSCPDSARTSSIDLGFNMQIAVTMRAIS